MCSIWMSWKLQWRTTVAWYGSHKMKWKEHCGSVQWQMQLGVWNIVLNYLFAPRISTANGFTSRGGKRPVGLPTIFEEVSKSYLKQSVSAPRPTKVVSAASQEKCQKENSDYKDRILSFEKFAGEVGTRFKNFSITRNGVNVSMFCLNENSSKVVRFISYREVNSKFGFLQLVKVCKNGYEIQKQNPQNFSKLKIRSL